MKGAFFFNCLLCFHYCGGQSLQTAPAVVRTGIYQKSSTNALQFLANQAALANVHHFATAVYGEKPFLLQALSIYYAAIAQPVGDGAAGLQLQYAGNADFNSSRMGLAYGRNIGEKAAAGIQFNYLNHHIRGYGNAAGVTVEGGVVVHLSEVLHAGVQLCNPMRISLNKTIPEEPVVYAAGLEYAPSQNVILTAELIKTEKLPVAVQAGVLYQFAKSIKAQAGINSSNASFYIAAGFQLERCRVVLVGSVHPQLGLSPGIMLLYNAMDK